VQNLRRLTKLFVVKSSLSIGSVVSLGSLILAGIAVSSLGCSASDAPATLPSAGAAGSAPTAGASGAPIAGAPANVAGAAGTAAGGANNGGASGSLAGGAAGVAGAAVAGAGGASAGSCPSGAIFCADFEEASGPPTGATLAIPDESGPFEMFFKLDTTSPFAGKQSLKLTSTGPFHFQMLAVPVPTSFWVRLYIKSDQDIGQDGHNAFFNAMTNANYHTSTTTVEVAEQFGCVLLNKSDTLFPPGNTCTTNKALAKDVWHCMEAQFDGTTGNVQVFADKTQILNAEGFAKATFTSFDFGYGAYHEPGRSVWYDDIAIATTRVGCP
jgi:hypothetical protein